MAANARLLPMNINPLRVISLPPLFVDVRKSHLD
jgi:hypothetical protein